MDDGEDRESIEGAKRSQIGAQTSMMHISVRVHTR